MSALTEVLESRLCRNGTRRRRHGCLMCGHRWTLWDGPRPPAGRFGQVRSTTKRGAPVTPDEVRQILLAPWSQSNAGLGRQLGISREMVRLVRLGRLHAQVHPELARRPDPRRGKAGRTCNGCSNWTGGECGFGFPEPLEEGPGFAIECDLYQAA
jgi:hypothetical protein